MSQLNISVTEDVQKFINEQVREKGYGNASEYVNYLIIKDREKEAKKRLDDLLVEGIDSGELIDITNDWLDDKKQQLLNQIKSGKS